MVMMSSMEKCSRAAAHHLRERECRSVWPTRNTGGDASSPGLHRTTHSHIGQAAHRAEADVEVGAVVAVLGEAEIVH
jgi:hypothetical protein